MTTKRLAEMTSVKIALMLMQTLCLIAFETGMQNSKWYRYLLPYYILII